MSWQRLFAQLQGRTSYSSWMLLWTGNLSRMLKIPLQSLFAHITNFNRFLESRTWERRGKGHRPPGSICYCYFEPPYGYKYHVYVGCSWGLRGIGGRTGTCEITRRNMSPGRWSFNATCELEMVAPILFPTV